MASGTIVRLLTDKGFGFISDEAGVEHFSIKAEYRTGCSSRFGKASGSSSPSKSRPRALAPVRSV